MSAESLAKRRGFSSELESAVQARHGHSEAKEDEDKRLWKKAWGFNLFPRVYLATRRQTARH